MYTNVQTKIYGLLPPYSLLPLPLPMYSLLPLPPHVQLVASPPPSLPSFLLTYSLLPLPLLSLGLLCCCCRLGNVKINAPQIQHLPLTLTDPVRPQEGMAVKQPLGRDSYPTYKCSLDVNLQEGFDRSDIVCVYLLLKLLVCLSQLELHITTFGHVTP